MTYREILEALGKPVNAHNLFVLGEFLSEEVDEEQRRVKASHAQEFPDTEIERYSRENFSNIGFSCIRNWDN